MDAFFIYLLKSTAILGLFLGVYFMLLKRETFFAGNRFYLLFGLLAALLLPVVEFTKIVWVSPANTMPVGNRGVLLATSNTVSWDWNKLFLIIYVLGVLVFAIRLAMQFFSLHRILQSGQIIKKGKFTHVIYDKVTAPFSFFNYLVYNPESCSSQELALILKHEKAHANQRHSFDIIFIQIFMIFQWCNPLVWWYRNTLIQNLEYLADNATVLDLPSLKEYQYTLLKLATGQPNLSITNQFFNSLIKKRIVMLHQDQSTKQQLWKYGTIVPLLILFLVTFNTKTVAQQRIEETVEERIESDKELHLKRNNEVIVGKITKNSTVDELAKLKQDIKKTPGSDLSYSKIKRNQKNEIYTIHLKYKTATGFVNGNYSGNSNEPIEVIRFGQNKTGGLFISMNDVKRKQLATKDKLGKKKKKNKRIKIKEKDKKEVTKRIETIDISNENGVEKIIVNGKEVTKEELEELGIEIEEVKEEEEEEETEELTDALVAVKVKNFNNKKPLYVVNGKKWNGDFEKDLDLTKVKTLNVIKPPTAVEKYGKDGKNGVVEVELKE